MAEPEHIVAKWEERKMGEETIDIFIILTADLHHIFVKINFTSTHLSSHIQRLQLTSLWL